VQKILEFLLDNVNNIHLREVYEYLLNIRSQAKLGDHIFLLIGSFLIYYLFCVRLRLHFEYGTIPKKSTKKIKKYTYKQKRNPNIEPTFFRWLYMLDSYSFSAYEMRHPKLSKMLFVYNAATVSVYICGTILMIPSFFNRIVCDVFIDIVFLHTYINVIPAGMYNLIYFLQRKTRDHNNS
jgi:hypothetical protein